MSGSTYAEQAANLIGPQIGVSPAVIYGQFVAENGASLDPSGAYNFGNLQPNGQEASYSTLSDFVSAFVSTIKNSFPKAENTGSNVNAYVAGLNAGGDTSSSSPEYETGVSAPQYAANITSGAATMSGTISGNTTTGKFGPLANLFAADTGQTAAINADNAAVASVVTSPGGALAKALGIDISAYDILLIIVGVILVLGSVFFISKPAVQSVTVQAGKLAKAIAT
jgi:hypothetical protein